MSKFAILCTHLILMSICPIFIDGFPTCASGGLCFGLPDPSPCTGVGDKPGCGHLNGGEARVTRCYCPGTETCSKAGGYQGQETYCWNMPTCESTGKCRDDNPYSNDLCKCPGKEGCNTYKNLNTYCREIPTCDPDAKCRDGQDHFNEICRCPQGTICRDVNNDYWGYGKDRFCLKPACGDAIPREKCCAFNGACQTKEYGTSCTCPGEQKCTNETYSHETFCCDDGKGCGPLPETTPEICKSLENEFYSFNADCNWFKSDQNKGKIKAETCYPTCKLLKNQAECEGYANVGCYWKNEDEGCAMNCRKINVPRNDGRWGEDCKNARCRFFKSVAYNNSFANVKQNECHAKCRTWLTPKECNESPVCSWRGGKCLLQCLAVPNRLRCGDFGCTYVENTDFRHCVPKCDDIRVKKECTELMGCAWTTNGLCKSNCGMFANDHIFCRAMPQCKSGGFTSLISTCTRKSP